MPKIKPQTTNGEQSADYQLTMKMLNEFRQTWQKLYMEAEVDPMVFSRLSVVALSQLTAIVAVDVGMTLEQFSNVCRAQHEEAYRRAPKFGP